MKFIEKENITSYTVFAKFANSDEFEVYSSTCEIEAINFYNKQIETLAYCSGLIKSIRLVKSIYTTAEYEEEVIEEVIDETTEDEINDNQD